MKWVILVTKFLFKSFIYSNFAKFLRITVVKPSKLTTKQVVLQAATLFHNIRWKYGIVVCPYCGSIHIKEHEGYTYKCNSCKARFSDKTNTLLHGSKLSVQTWILGIYEMFVDNFISSVTLAEKLGINQKSAWLMQAKIRYALAQDGIQLNGDTTAQDEMYIGGCLTNYHYGRKIRLLKEREYMGEDDKRFSKSAIFALNSDLKKPVFGMTDGDKVVLYNTPNPIKKEYIQYLFKKHSLSSIVVSDESKLYKGWNEATGTTLYTNNHHNNQYKTEEGLTSNAIENKFSWFKRGFTGRITHCKYLQLYLNEYTFRYNTRHLSTMERFEAAITKMIGLEITYATIKAYNPFETFEKLTVRKKKHYITDVEIKRMNDMIGTIGVVHR